MKSKNPNNVRRGKKAWVKYGEEWFEDEKQYKEKLVADGCEILAHRGGYPDFMYIKNGKINFAEIKKGNDTLKNQQKKVLLALKKAGFRVKILRYKKGEFEEDKEWE